MTVKAIAFDMDDTLLRDDLTISPYTLDVLRRASAKGIHILPASGRTLDSMRVHTTKIDCIAGLIACNGSECYDHRYQLIHQQMLPTTVAKLGAQFAKQHGCYAHVYGGKHFYYALENECAAQYAAASSLQGVHVEDLEQFITGPTPKVLLVSTSERIARLLPEAERIFSGLATLTYSKPQFIEINPLGATKATGLQVMGELLGFTLQDVLAFGDSSNDLAMLKGCGWGVAVGNAQPIVKEQVPLRCGTNQQDGVAHFIEEHLLKE